MYNKTNACNNIGTHDWHTQITILSTIHDSESGCEIGHKNGSTNQSLKQIMVFR
jgi:hypothetical protein